MNEVNSNIFDYTDVIDIGSWLPGYKTYEKKDGYFPVPFWFDDPPLIAFRSEDRPPDDKLAELIDTWRNYYDYLRNIKRASANTARIYMSDIGSFHEYLSEKYISHKEDLKKLSNYELWLSEKNPKTDGTSAVYALEVALEIEKLISKS